MSDVLPTGLDPGPRAVQARGLEKRFRDLSFPPTGLAPVHALDGLDLDVPEGAVYVLVGPNGAGKTTLLRLLLDRLRARELLAYHAAYHPAWDPDYAAELARRLEVMGDRRFGKLSKGHARRVQLVMALAHRPPLLLLDEPTDGLDPVVRDRVLELLADHLAAHETTVLLSTHLVHEAERLADHLGVLRRGRLVLQAPRAEVTDRLRRYRIRAPKAWSPPTPGGRLLRRRGDGRERVWSAWGEPDRIRAELEATGAEVREVRSLSLEEAALVLLDDEEA